MKSFFKRFLMLDCSIRCQKSKTFINWFLIFFMISFVEYSIHSGHEECYCTYTLLRTLVNLEKRSLEEYFQTGDYLIDK